MKQSLLSLSSPTRRILLSSAIAAATVISLVAPGLSRPNRTILEESPKAVLDEAWQIVNRDYVDPSFNRTDWQETRQRLLSDDYSSNKEAYAALRKALEQLKDPYTRFMAPEQFESLKNQTAGELSGVGIRLELNETTKTLTVVEPLQGSPAIEAGLQNNDQIVAIDGKSTKGMSVEDAAGLIRWEVGSKVVLRIDRSGRNEFDVTVTRARIELPTVRYTLREEGDTRVGYIRLSEFSSHAAEQMADAIKKLDSQKVEAFVLDLRGNPGGLLQSSIDISRMWLGKGLIVKTVDRKGDSEEIAANRTALTTLPLAVLVDGNSASSSEILTGALQDLGRATVIGTQTFGKALVQSVHSLSDGSGLAVTIAHYYTPKGTDISHKGITPDIKVDLSDSQRRRLASDPKLVGTVDDPQYAKAIEILQSRVLAEPGIEQPERQAVNNR